MLVGLLTLGLTAWADQLPADRAVPLRLGPNGMPLALQGFVPRSPHILPHESGCGILEAQHPDGREAVIVFDPGTEDAWGDVLLYIISGSDGAVLEWAGDPEPARCRATPSGGGG